MQRIPALFVTDTLFRPWISEACSLFTARMKIWSVPSDMPFLFRICQRPRRRVTWGFRGTAFASLLSTALISLGSTYAEQGCTRSLPEGAYWVRQCVEWQCRENWYADHRERDGQDYIACVPCAASDSLLAGQPCQGLWTMYSSLPCNRHAEHRKAKFINPTYS